MKELSGSIHYYDSVAGCIFVPNQYQFVLWWIVTFIKKIPKLRKQYLFSRRSSDLGVCFDGPFKNSLYFHSEEIFLSSLCACHRFGVFITTPDIFVLFVSCCVSMHFPARVLGAA